MNEHCYYLKANRVYDRDRNCYLISICLEGEVKLEPNYTEVARRLENKEVLVQIQSTDREFISDYIPLVKVDNVYYTEKSFQIPPTETRNNFANLSVDLVVRNALIVRRPLEDLFR